MRWVTIAKVSLLALAVPATILSVEELAVGLTYGGNLWRTDRPFAIALWLAVVVFPLFIGTAMGAAKTSRRLWIVTGVSWAFAAFWVCESFVWMPWAHGGPWGW